MSISKTIRRTAVGLALGASALLANAVPTTQLGFLIDASGSIGSSNFSTMRSGYAAALAALPTDGSIEVTVYTFATGSQVVVAPTVVTAASIAGIVTAVSTMSYTAGSTYTGAGINAITAAMLGSANFNTGLRSIINMATDGVPNDNTGNPNATAIAAAAAAEAAGIDALTAEALGSIDFNFLRDIVFSPTTGGPCNDCGVILADGATPPNPMTSAPWILTVSDFNDFPTAINAKVQAIIVDPPTGVPEPGSIALFGAALGLLAMARRRKS